MSTPYIPTLLVLAAAPAVAQAPASPTDGATAPGPSSSGQPVQLAWGDFDADGLDDALAISAGGQVALLRSTGDGSLEDVTAAAGLDQVSSASFALWADYDQDDRLDLFFGAVEGPSRLMQNQGGFFAEVTAESGITALGPHRSAHWVDYDGDGHLDLHLIGLTENALYHALGQGLFESVELPAPPDTLVPSSTAVHSTAVDSATAPTDEATGSRQPSHPKVGTGAKAGSSAGTTSGPDTVIQPGPQSIVSCVGSIEDDAGGGCIQAASLPTLGMLYPLSESLFVEEGTGNVGIGTTAPTSTMSVAGSADISGKIGIGTAGPLPVSYFMDVESDENYGLRVFNFAADPLGALAGGWYNDGGHGVRIRFSSASGFWDVGQTSTGNAFIIEGGGNVGIGTTTPTSTLSVDGGADISGNVGIGTTNPTELLDVNGGAAVDTLTIRGGADLVEGFETSNGDVLEPGTVVVIDPHSPGALTGSSAPYDSKVAGVVSGAGGVRAGLHLGQDGVMDGDTMVAMTGRVYVKCSAENGAIQPGDRLTTAALEGHAMKATDTVRSVGTVIGKAMSALDEGTGLVLVLVNLQ